MSDGFWFEAAALIPSIGVGLLFWFVMRSIMRADRREREAEREAERQFLTRRAEEKGSVEESPSTTD